MAEMEKCGLVAPDLLVNGFDCIVVWVLLVVGRLIILISGSDSFVRGCW